MVHIADKFKEITQVLMAKKDVFTLIFMIGVNQVLRTVVIVSIRIQRRYRKNNETQYIKMRPNFF